MVMLCTDIFQGPDAPGHPPHHAQQGTLCTSAASHSSHVLLPCRAHVISISESLTGVNKATVEVDVSVYERQTYGPEKLLVQGTVMCKKLGALRAL
eukprot:362536-Chlamydomonas_euryale.AAC.3